MPVIDIYVPGSWSDRDSGKVWQARTNFPTDFVLPDATSTDMPNNPTIIYNAGNSSALLLNAATRPVSGGPLWGYISSTPCTHGDSGLTGGYVSLTELNNASIPHAIGINVWGKRYLSQYGSGFVFPADRADSGYSDPNSPDYYGGNTPSLRMGSRLAIPPGMPFIFSPHPMRNLFWPTTAIGNFQAVCSAANCPVGLKSLNPDCHTTNRSPVYGSLGHLTKQRLLHVFHENENI